MQRMIIGIFNDRSNVEDAIEDLDNEGFRTKDISIVMKDQETGAEIAKNTGANVAGGAATGATTGAVLGGLAGALIGVGAITIPGIGALLIGGPLAAALGLTGAAATTVSGAATGALAGGLLGALMGLGIPEDQARIYEDRIKAGAILLMVPSQEGSERLVRDILNDNNATNISSVTTPTDRFENRRYVADSDFTDDYVNQDYTPSQEPRYAMGAKGGKTKTRIKRS